MTYLFLLFSGPVLERNCGIETSSFSSSSSAFFFFSSSLFNVPCGKFGSPYPGKAQPPQEQRYPFLSVYAVLSGVQTLVWLLLSVFGIFIVRTIVDVDARGCTRGLYEHRKRVCTAS